MQVQSEGDERAREQAALAIQEAWRRRQPELKRSAEPGLEDPPAGSGQSRCVVCLALVPSATHAAAGADEDLEAPLCVPCARRAAASGAGDAPGTRLTRLLRVEAEVRGQLQLLRGQHELLRAQAEALQAARRTRAAQAAEAQRLARERRRLVRGLLERRKREEERKFQAFAAAAEEEEGRVAEAPKAARKLAKKPRKKPAAPATSSPAAVEEASEPPTPAVAAPATDTASDKRRPRDAQEHARQLWRRRRQTLDCYAQDLAPLADGSRPKRLPTAAPKAKRIASPVVPSASASASASSHIAKPRRPKKNKAVPVGVRLRPLPAGRAADAQLSNQLDALESVRYRSGSPWPATAAPSPLTAEIKPVSWVYELEEDLGGSAAASASPRPLAAARTPTSSAASLFPPLLRPLPPPVAVSSPPPPLSVVVGGQWEYSSERLAGLLEKYSVSVAEAAGAEGRQGVSSVQHWAGPGPSLHTRHGLSK